MSACNFTIPFTKSATEILEKAKKTVESQGGTFEGDTTKGNFDVSIFGNTIKGSYTVNGAELNIDIIDKPFLVPCNMIESYLSSQLN
ncbi:hypothetical protein ACFOWM_01375 [Ferruginibacter yonginensis]|uniref:Uncharacterized protein n=1 Tax=Ferruginibacter yonginensis TaxID=1310416 RepID=A0ABV8QMI5_9BACT